MNNINEKEVVVITGASAGVGRAAVRKFAEHNASIGLIARGKTGLEAAKKEIEQVGGKALIFPVDVSNAKQVKDAAQKVIDIFGSIDIWINNAMVTVLAPFTKITPEEFKRVTEVTYLGTVYGTLAALKYMIPKNKGKIVQVGSALAYRSIPLQSAYCGAKHAIKGFTDSIRSELIHDKKNISITMVQMPGLNTPQFIWAKNKLPNKAQPVPPIYQPEIAANAIYDAAHSSRREIYVGLSSVKAILGNKLIPGILDHYLANTAYKGQQTDQKEDENRVDNLWNPVEENLGAHGKFDKESKNFSTQLLLNENKKLTAILFSSLTALGVGIYLSKKNN